MEFTGFTEEDFATFLIDGLEERMNALKEKIQPKLEALGLHFAPSLTALTGEEMFFHVAKHARRTKNPPNDTWVAFANNPRGYKMLPHFQIGLWNTHLFIWFAVIYESPNKQEIGKHFENKIDEIIAAVPENFVWSVDHTKPVCYQHSNLSKDQLLTFFQNVQTVKKAEILCGYQVDHKTASTMKPSELIDQIDFVFQKIAPLYNI